MEYKGTSKSFNVNSFNRVNKFVHTTIADDKPQVLQWLSPLEPQKRHQHLVESRLEGVGQWIFQTSEFRRWNTGDDGFAHSVLFCHGDPGVGKTHLSSIVIDHFYGSGQDIAVAGMYCDYFDGKEQTTSNMLGAMLKQLVGRGNIPGDMRKAFEDAKGHFGGVGPRVPQLLKMLKAAIAQRQRVVICIDGLDESPAEHRTGLLRSLQDIVRELPNVRLFLTGRPFIRSEVEKYFPNVDVMLVRPAKEDAEAYLKMKLDGDTEPDAMDECLRADIMETIPDTIADIFLLISLSIDAILAETTIHRRKEKLKQMLRGRDVGDIYTATLERIKAQKKDRSRLGMEAILWVAHAERPLRPDELCQALGVESGSKDHNNDNLPSIQTILNCGLGLVTVDSSSSTVRLVHFTLQEFILANPTLFHSPHSVIAEVCLTYLNFTCIRDISPTLRSPPSQAPFLEYAACYWGEHARRETNKNVVSLALNLLNGFETHISCKLLLLKEYWWDRPFDSEDKPIGFTGLHGGAHLGVAEIIVSLFEIKKWDINSTDLHGNTILAWAAMKGRDQVVQLLLGEESVNPDMADKDGRTPLSWAAGNGHEETVKILLEQSNANPDTADARGRTPLSWAARGGYGGIVRMLLERSDVNPEREDMNGRTPLSLAAGIGREGVVNILLEQNAVNPNAADKYGQTPLSWAAREGYKGVARVLLGRDDVSPDTADAHGRTPLSWAAGEWNDGIVKMLLQRSDVNPDTSDKSGQTPLSWAAGNGYEGIVEMLLGRNGVNPGTADETGRTPLSWAAGNGREGVVTMLLERDDVNPATADKSGRTPFSWAAGCGREGTSRILLQRHDIHPDTADETDRTPFSWAAGNGHERVVKILLELNDVNPITADKNGRTPFSWATGEGHERVVKMLLELNSFNPDSADRGGRTPLSWASGNGREGIAKMLLERSDVDPNKPDETGRTPFSWAASNWCVQIVKMLLERNDVNPDTTDKNGRTPFSWAASNWCVEIGKLLLEQDDVNPEIADKNGRTPFSWAAGCGREGIAKILLGRNDVNPDTTDKSGRTPLSWAAGNGNDGIVEMLLERSNVNSDTADQDGRTPLSWAAANQNDGIVEMLLERNDLNPDIFENCGRRPSPQSVSNSRASFVPRQGLQHDPIIKPSLRVGLSTPSTPLEPPVKRIRRS